MLRQGNKTEMETHDDHGNKGTRIEEIEGETETKDSTIKDSSSDYSRRIDKEEKESINGGCVIDIQDCVIIGKSRNNTNEDSNGFEKVCRICHFGSEPSSGESELISLGCECKGELGSSHPHCAELWFMHKGDRLCEICGKIAKNISNNNAEETSIFMMDWNEMRLVAATLDTSPESSCRCKQSFWNFILAFLVIAFMLPWFFRWMNFL